MLNLLQDIRYSLRTLTRVPALAATIVLTIGIGLGATTAMIAVVRAVLNAPLPYADAESLVWIYTDSPPHWFRLSVVDYRALEADHPAFSAIAAYQATRVNVVDGDYSDRVAAKSVTGSYFPLLGQRPLLGRLFDPSDDKRTDATVVLTHAYWTRRYGADPHVLGRPITIEGTSHEIIGVLENTSGPLEHDVALFRAAHWPAPTRKGPFFTTVIGRLRPDVSRTSALETLRATNRRLFPIWRSSYQDEKATWGILDLRKRVVGDVGTTLFFVLAAVGLVLLIASANAVNLLVSRGLDRSRDLAIRGALGASRARLFQHVIVEAGALAAGAAVIGGVVAIVCLQLIKAYGADYIPRIDEIGLSGAAIGWFCALAIASGVAMGLIPALQSSRLRFNYALQSGGRSTTDGPAARRVQRALVAAEFALATPLLVTAVLVLTSLDRLMHVPVGIETERVLTASISLPAARYASAEYRAAFWRRALDRIAAVPGVTAAALADSLPPSQAGNQNNFDLEDRPALPGQNQSVCTWVAASPEFFPTVGLRLVRGRLLDQFSLGDNVVVVDEAWGKRFFPGQEVLGRRFRSGGCTSCPWTTVVGLVTNVKWTGLDAPEDGTVYWPFVDFPTSFMILKTAGDPAAVTHSLRQAVRELDPALVLSDIATGDDLVAETLAQPRYLTVLIGVFAITALVLSIVGIYGIMTHFVRQHTRDIGIRLALGGEPARVRRMILLNGLRLVSAGVTVGIIAAVLSGRFVEALLFDISATDLRTMVAAPLLLVAAAVVAVLVPARRAARFDPAEILREQ
jgi:predicted permease